jgi:hypothetical protein
VPAVAPDQPPGAHHAGSSADEHAVAGVFELGDLHPATHRYAEPRDVAGEQLLQLTLRHHPRCGGRGVRVEVGSDHSTRSASRIIPAKRPVNRESGTRRPPATPPS